MSEKKYWWRDIPEIGCYEFCYDEDGNYDFTIEEVAVHYTYGWTEEKRQKQFKGAKFIFGGCSNGRSYHRTLEAETVEDAKKEFEAWYAQYLLSWIESLGKSIVTVTEDYEQLLNYMRK